MLSLSFGKNNKHVNNPWWLEQLEFESVHNFCCQSKLQKVVFAIKNTEWEGVQLLKCYKDEFFFREMLSDYYTFKEI